MSDTLLVAGIFLIGDGAVATFRGLHPHGKDRRKRTPSNLARTSSLL